MTTGRTLRAWIVGAAAVALIVPFLSVWAAEPLSIRHRAVDCVVANHYPTLSACFDPPERLARARVFFQLGHTAAWQSSEFRPEGRCFSSILPRPRREDAELRYYIEAVDVSTASTRLAEKTARVVGDTAACGEGVAAAFRETVSTAEAHSSGAMPMALGALALGGGTYALAGRGTKASSSATIASTPASGPAPGQAPTPSATPSPSPAPNPCAGDTTGPAVTIDVPAENTILSTSPATVRASASDANGVVFIEIFARRPITGTTISVGSGTSSPLQVSWSPDCNSALWTLFAQARDSCNNISTSANRTVTVAVATLSLCL